jgi:GT2 family glycosyltransferase
VSSPAGGRPQFSVVIATYNRPEKLRGCLEGLAALEFPRGGFEIIVSDDGGTTSLETVVLPFRDRLSITIVGHRNNTGPAAARNRGAARAQGTFLAFIDDDCVPAPAWLAMLARRFAHTPDSLIGGSIVNALLDNPFSTVTQLIVTYVYQYHDRRGQGNHVFNTGNLAVPAAQFRELGGFSEVFPLPAGEDYDFCHRWHHAGYRTSYAPEAVVYHHHVLTFAGFCRQHFRYGRGLFRNRLRIADRTDQRIKGEKFSFYLGLLRFPLQRGQSIGGWGQAALVALSQAATATGVIREALAQGWTQLVSGGRAKGADPDERP